MSLSTTKSHSWHRDGFLISTDPSLIDLQAINAAFDTDQLPWAQKLSDEELKVMVQHSVCFSLYSATTVEPADTATTTPAPDSSSSSTPGMIGLARICTDYVTMAYLTDVYILPEYQRRGLGEWLIDCVKEWWDEMPSGRQMFLIAKEGKAEEFYARRLASGRMENDREKKREGMYRVFTARGRGARV
ncbi:hypothetical protein LTR64_000079 [Lithohypha guttulata]|uniref:uncharacterized protein n=1 Tax=Lithohypha guttulata TaxID=1690604 RepID=UPI002DE14806|nr:hypothetical protein LTR51_007441 [Lithohypha guttulata]